MTVLWVALRRLFLAFWLGLLAAVGVHAEVKVVIVSSERSDAYLEAAQAIVSELELGGLMRSQVLELSTKEWESTQPIAAKLFVTLGAAAARAIAGTPLPTPVLCTLLPRASFEAVLADSRRQASARFSALYLDQPWTRQLDLIRLAMPNARKIGVLWGPQSQRHASALNAAARAQDLSLVEARVAGNDSLFAGLKKVLEDADVLLAVPDPSLYNSANIQNILLTSFRLRVPLIAFSPAYVHAGALLAVYASPKQLGLQAGTIASGVLQGKELPATPLYSQEFSIAVNGPVARSLGLSLDSDSLQAQLRQRRVTP
jgi:putative ABC transport system substrate-binding protein